MWKNPTSSPTTDVPTVSFAFLFHSAGDSHVLFFDLNMTYLIWMDYFFTDESYISSLIPAFSFAFKGENVLSICLKLWFVLRAQLPHNFLSHLWQTESNSISNNRCTNGKLSKANQTNTLRGPFSIWRNSYLTWLIITLSDEPYPSSLNVAISLAKQGEPWSALGAKYALICDATYSIATHFLSF